MRDDTKRLFSERDLAIVAAVAALVIGVGVVSAFPNGLHLSPSYEVRYKGTDTALLAGDIDIASDLSGTVALRNITRWTIAASGTVIVDTLGGASKTFVDPEISIRGGDGAINGTVRIPAPLTPGAVVFNGTQGGSWAFAAETISFDLEGATLTLSDAAISVDNASWTGEGSFSIDLAGGANATASVDFCVVSTSGSVEVSVERTARFNQTLLDVLDEEVPPLPVSPGGVAAVLPERGTTVTVDGEEKRCDNLSLGRGSWTASLGTNLSLRGEALLLLVDGSLYSPADSAIWFIPDKLLGLWPLAAGVWLVTSWLRRRYRQQTGEYDKELRWLAVIVHLLAVAVTFFLWDAEIRYLFGKSMLDAAMAAVATGTLSLSAWAVTPLELVPWFIGLALIALPIRVILSATFRLVGFDVVGGGVAKAVGLLSLLFIGTLYIPFFLNVTVLALLRNMLGL